MTTLAPRAISASRRASALYCNVYGSGAPLLLVHGLHPYGVTARVERFVTGLAAEATATERARLRAATVVLDPPRSGAGREVVDAVAAMRPAQIVYVACDPVALARDVAYFAERGYPLRTLRAFDLFPNTHHVEAVATLTP